MITLKWTFKMLADVFAFAITNRSFFMAGTILLLLVLGLVIIAAQVSAPFIYTLF